MDRKDVFERWNALAMKSGTAWLTSIPGASEITMVCLPTSTFPDELRAAGCELRAEGEQQWILPHAITERFCRTASGELEPITPGSTAPVVHVRTHAGIVRVVRFNFDL